jgi:hypothetical protein
VKILKIIHLLVFYTVISFSINAQGIIDSILIDNTDYGYIIDPISDELSLDLLPSYVDAPLNKMSLFIDFKNIDSVHQFITGYIINPTDHKHYFRMSSISSLILAEFNLCENQWQRFQTFDYGWCGTPYVGGEVLDSLSFRRVLLPYSIKGIKKLIRYKLYDYPPLVSNEGYGFIDTSEVYNALYDDIAFENFNLLQLTDIAYGNLPNNLSLGKIKTLRIKAIKYLFSKYGADRTRVVLFNLLSAKNEFSEYAKGLLKK